jgi:predicted negative regulator of RcsB-dependent stress response
VLLAQQKPKDAQKLLESVSPEGFDGEFHELRGDIQLALNDRAGAHASYQKALLAYASVPSKLAVAQMKLDDVADAAGSAK